MGNVLVVGSGIAGMQASLDLGQLGHRVFLLEKEGELGGNLRNLSEISPTHQKASELLLEYLSRIEKSSGITTMMKAEILEFSGKYPEFQALVKTDDKQITLGVNAVILATGIRPYNPSVLRNYGYGRFKDVVVSADMEKMVQEGTLTRSSNHEKPKSIAFIQCVGSRDQHPNANSYCSDFCCNNSVKLAQIIKRQNPDIDVSIFHIDMRTPCAGETEFRNARLLGIRFPRGKPARIREENGVLTLQVEDTLENDLVFIPFDLVVLSVGGVPDCTVDSLGKMLKVSPLNSGFFPVDEVTLMSSADGVFVAGSASGPKDIVRSMTEGSCAAAKVDICLRHTEEAM